MYRLLHSCPGKKRGPEGTYQVYYEASKPEERIEVLCGSQGQPTVCCRIDKLLAADDK
jgi:hypothetical protein